MDASLSSSAVKNDQTQIEYEFANVVIALENVPIKDLDLKFVGFRLGFWVCWRFEIEKESVVERGVALRSPMSVSLSGVRGVHPGFYKNITGPFNIFSRDVFGLHHGESQLIVLNWLWGDIPLLLSFTALVILLVFNIINVYPAENSALCKTCTWMIKFPVFDWLVLDCSPFWAIQSVIEINNGLSDQVISKQIIIVICLDLQRWSSWKFACELKALIESWVCFVKLVLVSPIEHLFTASDYDVWIRRRAQISTREVISLKEVKSNQTILWSGELFRKHGIITSLEQEFK